MRRSQTSPLLSIKHRWWFWLQPASIVLIWSLQSSSSNPFLDWTSICLNLIIVDKVIAPSWRWDITSFPPQPLHTTSQCKDHLSFFAPQTHVQFPPQATLTWDVVLRPGDGPRPPPWHRRHRQLSLPSELLLKDCQYHHIYWYITMMSLNLGDTKNTW